jgi:hypothetical protein
MKAIEKDERESLELMIDVSAKWEILSLSCCREGKGQIALIENLFLSPPPLKHNKTAAAAATVEERNSKG